MNRCLFCYQLLNDGPSDFHPACSRSLFGSTEPPVLPYSEDDISRLASEFIQQRISVTGVQPKISLDLTKEGGSKKFTVVGLWGNYILKPPSGYYLNLPENEDLIMHLAAICRIRVVPHSLIRMQSGSLAYITKRIDRTSSGKLHMEDMCQLTERWTEQKYSGSYEQIAAVILRYSANPVLDVTRFYELVLFCLITGNADMHLKNFSLLTEADLGCHLAPAYDLLCTAIANPADREELALTLNGKKRKLKLTDLEKAMLSAGITSKSAGGIFTRYKHAYIPAMLNFIGNSFLPAEHLAAIRGLIDAKGKALFGDL